MDELPEAVSWTQGVYRVNQAASLQAGKPVREHLQEEVIRAAKCPKHPGVISRNFYGVTSDGWLFKCKGDGVEDSQHVFRAKPAPPLPDVVTQ